MNDFRKLNLFAFAFLISFIGLLIFLYGFFPISQSIKFSAYERKKEVNATKPKNRYVDKLVLIIIDSLRLDFVIPKKQHIFLPYLTSSVLNNDSCLVTLKTGSPTVTMPRIKAVTSGSASNYVDVLLNLITSKYNDDNFIIKGALHGLKIVFYGDDTWLKLFPNTFHRSEGTSSFYVRDFTEVDFNVTRHIDIEMQKNDWDIMILHYLGLDHIGHLEGPNSALVESKLKDMDNIITKISNYFSLMEKKGVKTMVMVTGDHGMKDTGGHGGATYSEVIVPLVSVGKPCKILPGWPNNHVALQVDIAPTLCTLFGLPLPLKNIGKLIPNLFYWMEDEEIIQSLESNRLQLLTLGTIDSVFSLKNQFFNNGTKKKLIFLKYFEYLNQISQKLSNSSTGFNYFYLACGLILLWCSLLIFLFKFSYQFYVPQKSSQKFLLLGVLLHGLSFGSTSLIEEEHQIWYFFWITFCILAVFESITLKKVSFLHKIKNSLPWIIVSFAHRFLRKLNQTGDKWAFLSDFKMFLNSTEGQFWLIFLFLTALIMIFWLAASEHCSKQQLWLFGVSLICVFHFKINNKIIEIYSLEQYFTFRESFEILLFWMLIIMCTIQTFYFSTKKHLVWLLISSILLRPHNVILLPIQVFFSKQIYSFYSKENFMWIKICHIWLGNLFFFYQGNGNSLANIDIIPAFTGVKTYNPIYAGVLVTAHTFNSQILSFILCPKLNTVYGVLRLGPLTLYCTFLLFQLNHLFIWSVFSPKLLYESSVTLLILVLILLKHLCLK